MADSAIEWTGKVWNPVTGCQKVSPGCKHCYAEGIAERFWETQYPPVSAGRRDPTDLAAGYETRPRRFTDVQVHPDRLDQPLRWRKPARVFVNSMSDLFHEDVPAEFIGAVFATMAQAPQHQFQVLTKRPERMQALLQGWANGGSRTHDPSQGVDLLPPACGELPLPNVWLGVSVEDQQRADERIPFLLDTPAAVRFLSCEPLLGPVDLDRLTPLGDPWLPSGLHPSSGFVDWLIVGGESGPKARPMDLAWARSLVEQGRAAGVPVFVKQLGAGPEIRGRLSADADYLMTVSHSIEDGEAHLSLRDRKGGDPEEWPADLRVREFPAAVPS